jgi:hypothetical protein
MNQQMRGVFFVDAHTHLYPMYNRVVFFDGALAHVSAAAERIAPGQSYWGCLLFSETVRDHAFLELSRQAAEGVAVGRWSLRPTAEVGSLLASREGEDRLILVAGRQIQTAEDLEVLALFCESEIPERLPLRSALAEVCGRDALAVLPWGFGKWWLGRGRLLDSLLRSDYAMRLALGDNGGRPIGFPTPPAFRLAESTGRLVLPGSDTLPLDSEMGQAAHYGFVLEGSVECERPGTALKRLLLSQTKSPPPFGRRVGLGRFVRNQIKLRLDKSAGRAAAGGP